MRQADGKGVGDGDRAGEPAGVAYPVRAGHFAVAVEGVDPRPNGVNESGSRTRQNGRHAGADGSRVILQRGEADRDACNVGDGIERAGLACKGQAEAAGTGLAIRRRGSRDWADCLRQTTRAPPLKRRRSDRRGLAWLQHVIARCRARHCAAACGPDHATVRAFPEAFLSGLPANRRAFTVLQSNEGDRMTFYILLPLLLIGAAGATGFGTAWLMGGVRGNHLNDQERLNLALGLAVATSVVAASCLLVQRSAARRRPCTDVVMLREA